MSGGVNLVAVCLIARYCEKCRVLVREGESSIKRLSNDYIRVFVHTLDESATTTTYIRGNQLLTSHSLSVAACREVTAAEVHM